MSKNNTRPQQQQQQQQGRRWHHNHDRHGSGGYRDRDEREVSPPPPRRDDGNATKEPTYSGGGTYHSDAKSTPHSASGTYYSGLAAWERRVDTVTRGPRPRALHIVNFREDSPWLQREPNARPISSYEYDPDADKGGAVDIDQKIRFEMKRLKDGKEPGSKTQKALAGKAAQKAPPKIAQHQQKSATQQPAAPKTTAPVVAVAPPAPPVVATTPQVPVAPATAPPVVLGGSQVAFGTAVNLGSFLCNDAVWDSGGGAGWNGLGNHDWSKTEIRNTSPVPASAVMVPPPPPPAAANVANPKSYFVHPEAPPPQPVVVQQQQQQHVQQAMPPQQGGGVYAVRAGTQQQQRPVMMQMQYPPQYPPQYAQPQFVTYGQHPGLQQTMQRPQMVVLPQGLQQPVFVIQQGQGQGQPMMFQQGAPHMMMRPMPQQMMGQHHVAHAMTQQPQRPHPSHPPSGVQDLS